MILFCNNLTYCSLSSDIKMFDFQTSFSMTNVPGCKPISYLILIFFNHTICMIIEKLFAYDVGIRNTVQFLKYPDSHKSPSFEFLRYIKAIGQGFRLYQNLLKIMKPPKDTGI